MTPWRLEVLRLWRTRRLIALAATFLILGLAIPVLTYYLPDLVKNAGNGVRIVAPKQTPADAVEGFAANIGQLGTLVVVIVAAANLAIDARPALAAFYRTRVRRPARLVLPRYSAVTAASIAALALGTIAVWYETTILLGAVGVGALLGGFALEAVWLCFATAVVAACSSVIRGVAGVVGCSITLLLALGLLQNLAVLRTWLPTRLAGSAADLVQHSTGGLWHALLVTILATLGALGLAVDRLGKRELDAAEARPDRPRRR
jgi:ABC-2 type transport system permease protein